jgi:arylsulfatase A-like enzyme
MRLFTPTLSLFGLVLLGLAACSDQTSRDDPADALPALANIENPPNVVLIIANDLGVDDTSAYLQGRIKTPNLERLGQGGVVFQAAYAASSVTGPSRAGIITGTHPSRIGYEYDNGPGARDEKERLGLPLSDVTLGSALQEQKYTTGYIGLWGLGGGSVHYPTNRGYSEFYGILSGETPYMAADAPDLVTIPTPAHPAPPAHDKYTQIYTGPDSDTVDNGQTYLTRDISGRAVEFIEKHKDGPFALTVAYTAPHGPLQAEKSDYDQFQSLANPNARMYAAMVTAMDTGIGQILKALERAKVAKDTIVIFISDNGCDVESAACTCTGLRGGAATLYDGGLRVPFIMRWPGKIPAKTTYARPVSLLDIYATLLPATNTSRPAGKKLDGVDLLPYLKGEKKTDPHPSLVWLRRPTAAIRYQDWKLISNPIKNKTEIYDLSKDPNETNDLSALRTDMLQKLQIQLELDRTFASDPLWRSAGMTEIDFCQQTTEIYR